MKMVGASAANTEFPPAELSWAGQGQGRMDVRKHYRPGAGHDKERA